MKGNSTELTRFENKFFSFAQTTITPPKTAKQGERQLGPYGLKR